MNQNKKYSHEHVRSKFLEKNLILLSSEYKGALKNLEYQCNICGYLGLIRYNNLVSQNQGCRRCAGSEKHTIEFVKEFATKKGIEILSETYEGNKKKLDAKCAQCQHQWKICFNKIQQGRGCPVCGYAIKRRQTYIEKYGVDNPIKNTDIKTKIKSTNLKRYGVESPAQNRDIQLKSIRSSNNIYVVTHWKTNEEIVCRGGYEKAVVEWLNENKIDFQKEISFDMPNGKIYFVDFYIPDRDLYIEVKGRKFEYGMKKWEWFHKKYPNSEMWDKETLKKMRLI